MADNGEDSRQTLVPPAVTALRQADGEKRTPMERSNTADMRAERDDLKAAAEQSLNVILDLSFEGTIRWASPSWADVVGTSVESVKDRPVADLLLSNKDAFSTAVESMKKDDSKSRIIRFQVQMGPLSLLRRDARRKSIPFEGIEAEQAESSEEEQILNLEGQGIIVFDRSSGEESHVRQKPRFG